MTVLIDNYDSFTYNIVQYIKELGEKIVVVRNDELSCTEIEAMKPDKLILSPGPSTPENAGITLEAIGYFKDKLPILGVCLGHQAIAHYFGAKVIHAKRLMHGKTSLINVSAPSAIFGELPKEFVVARYHSLVVEKSSLPDLIVSTAFATDDGEIMALEVKNHQIYGVQFHPESIVSEHGHKIFANFLKL